MGKHAELDAIAKRITEHLVRFEASTKHNPKDSYGTRPFYFPNARRVGSRLAVTYVSYQGSTRVSADEAVAYLAWLDAGNVGKHWKTICAKEGKSE